MANIPDRELNRLKSAIKELSTLNRIAGTINVSMSIDKISRIIVDHCLKRIGAAQGTIFLIDDEQEKSEQLKTFVREIDSGADQIPLRLNLSLTGWIIKNKQILLSNNPKTDQRFPKMNFDEMKIGSILAAPLLTRKGLIGVLALFNKNSDDGFSKEDKRFAGIVAAQTASVIENARLFEREKKLVVIEEELNIAKNIQQGFLPKNDFVTDDAHICGVNVPAKEMGGDYFDIVELNNEYVFVSLGDVSGKGMPAALLMANAQAVLRSQLYRLNPDTLPEIAQSLNHLIYQFTTPAEYITAIFGLYNRSDGVFQYINAGHIPPIIVSKNGQCHLPENSDLVIGVLPEVLYKLHEIKLEPGEAVFICTDGITEAEKSDGEQFEEERLIQFLSDHCGQEAVNIRDKLLSHINSYRGDAIQSDDITMLILKRL